MTLLNLKARERVRELCMLVGEVTVQEKGEVKSNYRPGNGPKGALAQFSYTVNEKPDSKM